MAMRQSAVSCKPGVSMVGRHRRRRGKSEIKSGRWGPYRQAGPPPARHRPGARSARLGDVFFTQPRTAGGFIMPPTKHCAFRVEQLEDRAVPSANVVLEWNTRTLEAIKATSTNPLLASRALAITQAAVYDAVNAIDGTYTPYAFKGQAPPTASPEAAAATAAYHTLVKLFPTRRAD